jgi:predicted nucleotidyltransferase
MNIEKIIYELKARIIEHYPDLIGIYLYGSRAKGDYYKGSDLDILLLFPVVTQNKKFEIYGLISYLEYKFEVFIDVKILTPDSFKKNPFYYEQVTNFGKYFGR